MNNEREFFKKAITHKSEDKTDNSEKDFFHYAVNEYNDQPSKGSVVDFISQLKQIPMQSLGVLGAAGKGLTRAAQIIGAGQEQEYPQPGESISEQPNISEQIPFPTSESIGKKIGYQEPNTLAGRYGKAIFSNVGSAIPLVAASPAAAIPALSSTIAGGIAGQTARELGAPESLAAAADIASTIGSGIGMSQKLSKPSGLTARRFEDIEKRMKISPSQYESIKSKVETESKDLIENLFSKNPVYEEMKQTPEKFFENLDSGFERVKNLANVMPITTTGDRIQNSLLKRFSEKKFPPITMGEKAKSYNDQMTKIYSEIDKDQKFGLDEIIDQFRHNNKDLKGYFESTKSGAMNEGKKEALLDYNRALSDEIHNRVPNSSLDKLFQNTNKRFSDSMNINKTDDFIDSVFKENKIDYSKIKEYFKDKELKRSISQTFGKETEDEFSKLMKDVLSQEKGMRKLRPSETAKLHPLSINSWVNKAKSILKGGFGLSRAKREPSLKKSIPGISGKGVQEINRRNKKEKTIEDVLGY